MEEIIENIPLLSIFLEKPVIFDKPSKTYSYRVEQFTTIHVFSLWLEDWTCNNNNDSHTKTQGS